MHLLAGAGYLALLLGALACHPTAVLADDCLLDTKNDGNADTNVDTDSGANSNGRFNNLACGSSATASGSSSTALGFGTFATGASSTAVGGGANALATQAVAFGSGAQATRAESTAIGSLATASGTGATALGRNADAIGDNAQSTQLRAITFMVVVAISAMKLDDLNHARKLNTWIMLSHTVEHHVIGPFISLPNKPSSVG